MRFGPCPSVPRFINHMLEETFLHGLEAIFGPVSHLDKLLQLVSKPLNRSFGSLSCPDC